MTGALRDYAAALEDGRLDRTLAGWYGGPAVGGQKERYRGLLADMENLFGDGPAVVASAPGRTELGGNHTDHNHGRVLTAAIHLDLAAVALPSGDLRVSVRSDGFPEVIRLDLAEPGPLEEEKGSPESLIRGMASGFQAAGFKTGGFNARVHGNVPVGTGLSTSAAFEVLIGTVLSGLFNAGAMDPVRMAVIGQAAETRFFGKPCGLMDQMASSAGGVLCIDFADPQAPELDRIDVDFDGFGYRLVVVDTGGSHADMTGDYAAIPKEMGRVSAFFGREALRGLTMGELLGDAARLRDRAGDRAILRAMHFIEENDRVADQAAALREGRFEDYLRLTALSGDSSWRLLQNCARPADDADQGIPLALAMTERFLEGRGACRVHGGGFAGTIQAYIPEGRLEDYRGYMERVFGPGTVIPLHVRPVGGALLSWDDPGRTDTPENGGLST